MIDIDNKAFRSGAFEALYYLFERLIVGKLVVLDDSRTLLERKL